MKMNAQYIKQGLPKQGCKLEIPIKNTGFRQAMVLSHILVKSMGNFKSSSSRFKGHKMTHLAKLVHNNKNRIVFIKRNKKVSEEIHSNNFPLAKWYLKRFQQSCRRLTIRFITLASFARHKTLNCVFYVWPPEISLNISKSFKNLRCPQYE